MRTQLILAMGWPPHALTRSVPLLSNTSACISAISVFYIVALDGKLYEIRSYVRYLNSVYSHLSCLQLMLQSYNLDDVYNVTKLQLQSRPAKSMFWLMATNSQLIYLFWLLATCNLSIRRLVWQLSDKVHAYHAFQQMQISNAFTATKTWSLDELPHGWDKEATYHRRVTILPKTWLL